MGTLQQDIKTQAAWLVQALQADGLKLDYSIDSLRELDRFFELHAHGGEAVAGGRLAQNLGNIIFSTGSYLGETMIRNTANSHWVTNDSDPEGEVNAEVHIGGESIIWPMQRAMKRFKNGAEDDFFTYGVLLTRDDGGRARPLSPPINPSPPKPTPNLPTRVSDAAPPRPKPWWKFW